MSQNFSSKRNIISFLLIATMLVLFVYISYNPYQSQQESIRIGITQWPGYKYLYMTKQKGFFKKFGLDIELVELSSLAEVRRAFERGKIDGMASTVVEVLEAYKYSGQTAQPIAVIDYSNGADEILANKKLDNIKELKGKKIGVEAGSSSAYLVSRALEMNNISNSQVIIMPMELHKLSKALQSGKVDAITSYPPISILIKKQVDLNVLFDSSLIPQNLLNIVSINKEVLKNKPELQNSFIQAWGETLRYAENNPQESYQILTEDLPITTQEFKKAMSRISLVSTEEQDEYFNENILNDNFIQTGNIIFKHLDTSKIDYSMFQYSNQL